MATSSADGNASFQPLRRLLWVALAACVLLPGTVAAESPVIREDRIKAALIFKLVKFIEWPPATLAHRETFQLCALGSSGVGEALAAADGKSVRDRTAQFRRIDGLSAADVKACHVLYLPGSAREIGGLASSALRGRSILTVSDAPDFARRGGMIGLIRGENKVTFEINLHNAREAGLEPEAILLELATVVD